MPFIAFLLVFFISSDSWAASQSLSLSDCAQVETKRQKEIREQFFPGENQRRSDSYLDITNLPHDTLDIVRGYLRDDRDFWVASVQSQVVSEEGAVNAFTVGTKQALYAVFEMADHSLKVQKVTSGGAQSVATLRGHLTPVCCVAISPDGKYLCAADDRDIKIWDLHTCACRATHFSCLLPFSRMEFVTEGNDAFYVMTYNDKDCKIDMLLPRIGELAFVRNAQVEEDHPALFKVEELRNGEVVFTLQDLGARKVLAVTEHHCFVYDRQRWELQNTHRSLQELPEYLLAGRVSETYQNRLFVLTEEALYTYYFDCTKQEYAQLLSKQPIKKIQFSFPAHVMLSDDGRFCAGISKNYFDLWDLAHEIRLYHVPLTGNQLVQINKLFFSPQGYSFAIVDDATKQVTCHFFDAEIAQHLYSLALADAEFIQNMVQKNALPLNKQERSHFATLPMCVQENLRKNCKLNLLEDLSMQQKRVVDLFLAKPRTVPPHKVKLTKTGAQTFAMLPSALQNEFEKSYDIRRPWAWWKKTAVIAASALALDFLASRFVTKKPMLVQYAWHFMLSLAVASQKVFQH